VSGVGARGRRETSFAQRHETVGAMVLVLSARIAQVLLVALRALAKAKRAGRHLAVTAT